MIKGGLDPPSIVSFAGLELFYITRVDRGNYM